MKGIFAAIVDFFAMIGSIFEFIFKILMVLINLLVYGMKILFEVITILPTPFLIGALGLIIVCIVYKILGRENQS